MYYLEKSEDGYSAIKGNGGFSMEVFFCHNLNLKKIQKLKIDHQKLIKKINDNHV